MIKEIVEFMDANEGIEEYFIQDEVSKSYEHYYIKINGEIVCRSIVDLDLLNDDEMKNILKYMTYYQKGMHNKYLDKNNGLGGSSPYILTVKLLFDGNNIKTNIEEKDKNRIEVQFKSSLDYVENDIQKNEITELQKFMVDNLEKFLLSEKQFSEILKKKYDNQKNDKKAVFIDIRIYIDIGLEKVKFFYESFVKKERF